MKNSIKYLLAAVFLTLPTVTSAKVVSFVVDAKMHSSNTMNGLATGVFLEAGELFSVVAEDDDVWFLGGATTEYTNANGLSNYPLYTQDNMTALYGVLAGRVGEGAFFKIGTQFNGQAVNAGELFLYNWDSGNSNNLDQITATITTIDKVVASSVSAVPVPASGSLLIAALARFGLLRRRRWL